MTSLKISAPADPTPINRESRPAPLTTVQRQSAWTLIFRVWLEDHSNAELSWEAAQWRALDVPSVAAIVEALLAERERDGFDLPHVSTPHGLDLLWDRVDQAAVLALVREGLSLVVAARTVYWLTKDAEEQDV